MSVLAFPRSLAAPPARVFAALTEARHLERWFCDRAESEPGAGGRLVLRWQRATHSTPPFEARWLAFDPPRHAAFRGGHARYPNADAGVVGFTLVPEGTGTRLDVRHEVPDDAAYAALEREWTQAWPRALTRLAAYLAPLPASPA